MTTYSSSSSPPRTWKYNVFTSFHGQEVRKKFLSHLCKQFSYNGITMFDDQGVKRGHTITPALIEAIRESRISIVFLSKNYASSSWCLDELLEILKCKEDEGQIVMPVFYEVDPSNVRKQTGDFGIVFKKTCACKTKEEQRKWSESLTYVGNIAGEDFKNWDNEANMIEWIARYVSDKLNATPSRDFHGIVGLDGHLKEMKSLLELDYDGVKIVGISGPAGIGKTTIARALHSTLSNSFQHTCFMDKLNGSYNHGLDEYGLQLYLQEQLLSKVLNLKGFRVSHLGVIKDRLHYHKVLIILDDVESLDHLDALADIRWFGPGSRIIVTTGNKEILQQHGINDIYHVSFPSRSEALEIFCLSAFKQTFPPNGFVDLVDEVASMCGELPLGLHVFGSSLRGKSPADWIDRLPRLKNSLDGRIESVLKVGYESLDEEDQDLFLFIAVFFNYEHVNCVTSILSNTDVFDVRLGLKNLANRSLIHICGESKVEMHRLLQVMTKRVISKQKLSKRKILDHTQDICYVLENAKGNGSVLGLSLDIAEINRLKINKKAFKGMYNLHILKVYNGSHHRKKQLHVPEEMKFPPNIRLLHWEAYPGKSLLRFCPEYLVKLNMKDSQLEKLWEGTQPLANLKEMNFRGSSRLKELPDLSNATNLEKLDLSHCTTLVALPSSIANLHKISNLRMSYCRSLEVIPSLANLTSLKSIMMEGCSRLRIFPNISTNVKHLMITQTLVEEWPGSLRHCSRLKHVALTSSRNLKTFSTHLPTSVRYLYLENSGIERFTDCIKWLHNLQELKLSCCKRLLSLPELPGSLKHLRAENCVSLERISGPLNTPNAELNFTNCFKLSQQARRAIIQQTFVKGWAILPGREVPADFDHRATGSYLTFPHSGFNRFKVCVVISSFDGYFSVRNPTLLCFCSVIGSKHSVCKNFDLNNDCKFQTEHLFIFDISLSFIDHSEVTSKIELSFKRVDKGFNIIDWGSLIECGVKILRDETDRRNNGGFGDEDDLSYTLELAEVSSEEDDDVDSITNERFESDSDNEDYKRRDTYESGEPSKDKDEGSSDDGDCV